MSAHPATATGHDPAAVLGRAVRESATGLLSVTSGRLRRLFCLDAGRLIFSASNLIEEQLDESLVAGGLLAASDRAVIRAEANRDGIKPLARLLQSGLVDEATLRTIAAKHYTDLLLAGLATRDPEVRFDRGKPALSDELTVEIDCIPLLLRHAAEHATTTDALRVRIGPPDARPERVPDTASLLDGVELSPAAIWLLESCDGGREIDDLLATSLHDTEPTLRALLGLLHVGALRLRAQEGPAPAERVRVSREELANRIDRAVDADHFGILGLDPSADADQVRSAYYYLARRYHPDRFRSRGFEEMMPRIETYFAQVTEAYNTLVDPVLREQYDEERASQAGEGAKEERLDHRYIAKQNFLRAKALVGKRQYQAAVPFLENAIEQDDSQSAYHLELGRVLVRAPRRRDEAEQALRRAAEINPANVEPYLALGGLYALQGRTDDAIAAYREALRWKPGEAEAREAIERLGASADSSKRDEGGLFGGLFKGKK